MKKEETYCEDELFEDIEPLKVEVVRELFQVIKLEGQMNFKILTEKGLYPAQAVCLWYISKNEGINQKMLAEQIVVAAPTVSMIIKKLEGNGFIERKPSPEDMRTLQLFLTEKGKNIIGSLRISFSKIMNIALDGFNENELKIFKELLKKLDFNISNYLQEGEVNK